MRARTLFLATCTLVTMSAAGGGVQHATAPGSPLTVSSVTVTIEGTSRKDPFVASTKTVRITRVRLAEPRSADALQQALRPGGLEAFDVAIPVTSLSSPNQGVDAHIHRSLEADSHPEIRFQLRSIAGRPDDGTGFTRLTANGALTVAGTTRDVALDVTVVPAGRSLLIDGSTDVLMTDFGVTPPAGLLRLLQTDPLIHVRFNLIVSGAPRQ